MPTDREQQMLTLVRDNSARLRRICRVYARNEDQRDLLQDILLQLWRSLPSFAGASSPHTWLYRVALNTALAYARRNPARQEIPIDEEHEDIEDPVDARAQMDAREQLAQLHAAIAKLDVVERMLVTMYLDERTYREMADVIGISENHVGVKLHRIRKVLTRQLAEEIA